MRGNGYTPPSGAWFTQHTTNPERRLRRQMVTEHGRRQVLKAVKAARRNREDAQQ